MRTRIYIKCYAYFLQEGSIVHVAISLNEKALAVSTSKGLVLITVDPFLESNVDPLVFTEHEGNNITAIIWYFNYLYCGDHIGNISVIDIGNSFVSYFLNSRPVI